MATSRSSRPLHRRVVTVAAALLAVVIVLSVWFLVGRASAAARAEETRAAVVQAAAGAEADFLRAHRSVRENASGRVGADPDHTLLGYACTMHEPRERSGEGWLQTCEWLAVDLYRSADAQEIADGIRRPVPPSTSCTARSWHDDAWRDLLPEGWVRVAGLPAGGGEDMFGEPCALPALPEHAHLTETVDPATLDPADGWVLVSTELSFSSLDVGCGPGFGCPAPFDAPAMPADAAPTDAAPPATTPPVAAPPDGE